MTKYTVLQNLNHDSTAYEKGAVVELDPEVAAPLVEDGVLVESSKAPKEAPKSDGRLTQTKEEKEAARKAKGGKQTTKEPEAPKAPENKPEDEKTGDENDENEPEMVKRPATQEDLDTNPELVEKGVKVGDEIEVPKDEADDEDGDDL